MIEADLNTIIKNSIKEKGWCHKISDQGGQAYTENPFDLFGVYEGKPIYIESKLIKGGIYSLNLDRIEEHQYKNLNEIKEVLTVENYCLYAVGFYKPREMKIVMFFDSDYVWKEKQNGKKSFLKKELEEFYNQGKYYSIKSILEEDGKRHERIIDFDNLKEKIIYGKEN